MNDEAALPGRPDSNTTRSNGSSACGSSPLLTAAELGDYLGLTAGAVLDRFQRGDLPGYRLFRKGGPVRFSTSDVASFLESCRVEARSSRLDRES